MSVFDDIKGKAAGLVNGNEAAIRNGIDKAGNFIDSKTGDKFKDKVDGVQNAANGFLGKVGGNPNTRTDEGTGDRPA